MPNFKVFVREVHIQEVLVDGVATAQDAITQVQAGHGTYVDNGLEYSHCLDADTWTAEETA